MNKIFLLFLGLLVGTNLLFSQTKEFENQNGIATFGITSDGQSFIENSNGKIIFFDTIQFVHDGDTITIIPNDDDTSTVSSTANAIKILNLIAPGGTVSNADSLGHHSYIFYLDTTDLMWKRVGGQLSPYQDGDSVGIGMNNPTEMLDVTGNIHASGTITSGASITIDGDNAQITSTTDKINIPNTLDLDGTLDMSSGTYNINMGKASITDAGHFYMYRSEGSSPIIELNKEAYIGGAGGQLLLKRTDGKGSAKLRSGQNGGVIDLRSENDKLIFSCSKQSSNNIPFVLGSNGLSGTPNFYIYEHTAGAITFQITGQTGNVISSGNVEQDTSFANVFTNKSDMVLSETGSNITINADTSKIPTGTFQMGTHLFQNNALGASYGNNLTMTPDNGSWGYSAFLLCDSMVYFRIPNNRTEAFQISDVAGNNYMEINTNTDRVWFGMDIDLSTPVLGLDIFIRDNNANALSFLEGANSYLNFITTNSDEKIEFGKNIDLIGNSITGTSVDINNSELQQYSNLGATTINGTQWGYVGGADQPTKTTDDVTFGALNSGQITTTDDTIYSGSGYLSIEGNSAINQGVRTTDTVIFGQIGINKSATSYELDILGDSSRIEYEGISKFIINGYGSNKYGNLILGAARNTIALPYNLLQNYKMGTISFVGYQGSGFVVGSYIQAVSTGTWAGGNIGTDLKFYNAKEGSNSPLLSMTIQNDNNILFERNVFITTGDTLLFTDPTLADSLMIYDNGTNAIFNSENPFSFNNDMSVRGDLFIAGGSDFWLTDASGVDSARIRDDGDTTRFESDNPFEMNQGLTVTGNISATGKFTTGQEFIYQIDASDNISGVVITANEVNPPGVNSDFHISLSKVPSKIFGATVVIDSIKVYIKTNIDAAYVTNILLQTDDHDGTGTTRVTYATDLGNGDQILNFVNILASDYTMLHSEHYWLLIDVIDMVATTDIDFRGAFAYCHLE